MGAIADPVGVRVVSNLPRPKTGFASQSVGLKGKRLELLKELLPRLARVRWPITNSLDTITQTGRTLAAAHPAGYPSAQMWEGRMRKFGVVTATIFAMSFGIGAAAAAELRLLASPGVRGLIEELAPRFQAKTGHKIVGDFEVIAKIKKRIDDGERFDITVLSPEAIASLIADKKIDHQAPFARAGMGVGFRKGAAK